MASCDLSNKVAIVTGASSGLGQATAVLFAQKGASVVLCGRNEERLDAAVSLCRDASGGQLDRFISVAGDLKNSDVRKNIVEKAIATFGKLDILVANAGVSTPKASIDEATEEIFDEIVNTNVKSVFFLIQAAVTHLEKAGGNVVIVSSLSSTMPIGEAILYPMSKAAVDHMATCLSLSLGPRGVRVNTVNPSFVPTKILRNFVGDITPQESEAVSRMVKSQDDTNHPLHGECVTADDVANSIAFLTSESARCITGQSFIVDNARRFTGIWKPNLNILTEIKQVGSE